MYDAISLLEHLARTPYAGEGAAADLAMALDPAARAAFRTGDAPALAAAMGGRAFMACVVYAPDQEEPAREDGPVDDQPEPAEAPDAFAG